MQKQKRNATRIVVRGGIIDSAHQIRSNYITDETLLQEEDSSWIHISGTLEAIIGRCNVEGGLVYVA